MAAGSDPAKSGGASGAFARGGERGFTLLELIIAMAVFSVISLGIYGVIVLGARSAGSGERITEQARRYRVANEVVSRQIASAAPICLPNQNADESEFGFEGKAPKPVAVTTTEEGDDDNEDDDSEDDETSHDETVPFFYGGTDTIEFITTAAQRPDASGMSIVRYWVEDGALRMSERPVFSAYSRNRDEKQEEADSASTILLYDVDSVTFSYQRESDSEEWLETWDATDEDQLPATVRIDVKPSAVGGPDFYHEIAVMVGTFNQITDADEEFHCSGGGG